MGTHTLPLAAALGVAAGFLSDSDSELDDSSLSLELEESFFAAALGLAALLAGTLVEAFSLITGFLATSGFAFVTVVVLALDAGLAVLDSGLF